MNKYSVCSVLVSLCSPDDSQVHSDDSETSDQQPRPGTVKQQTSEIENRLKHHRTNSASSSLSSPDQMCSVLEKINDSSESPGTPLGTPEKVDLTFSEELPQGIVLRTKKELQMIVG